MTSRLRDITGLVSWLALTLAAGGVGAVASAQAKPFYLGLVRPEWAPPPWLFGPVWTALYVAMGVAAWRVWRRPPSVERGRGLVFFALQLALNALWSWLFFAWHLGQWAFVDIVILWLLILATLVTFIRCDRVAGWLLIPYLAWVTFAGALCYSVWKLNPAAL